MNVEPRLRITERMRRFLDYPRFARREIRILILDTGYFFDEGWRRAAAALGWRTRTVKSAMTGEVGRRDIEELFKAVVEFQPDFILTSNYGGIDVHGLFSRFFEDVRIPYVSWFTDTPRMILHERQVYLSPYNVAAVWERAYIPYMRSLGFAHVVYMPLATDPVLFDRPPGTSWARPVAFVGNSMVNYANDAWRSIEHRPDIVKAILDAFAAGRVTREIFAEGIAAIIGADLLDGCEPHELRHIELCFIYEATRRARAELALMTERFGLEVRGDEHWRMITGNTGGPLAYHADLAGYYNTTSVNLNSTSLQMRTAVNQRVLDCPAAGGFLITDAQADLDVLFDPDEVVTYSTLEELQDKIRYYLPRPEARIEVVSRARRRVLAHHTHQCRLESLVDYLRAIFA